MVENGSKGVEVIVGMMRDATFGPMIMFGMGGTMVELVKIFSWSRSAVRKDIESMVAETMDQTSQRLSRRSGCDFEVCIM